MSDRSFIERSLISLFHIRFLFLCQQENLWIRVEGFWPEKRWQPEGAQYLLSPGCESELQPWSAAPGNDGM
jgi:hypothetical protein